MNAPAQILMISKPIVPPFNDSGKNIVFEQIQNRSGFNYRVLTTRENPITEPGITSDPIYPGSGSYKGGIKQNLRVLMHGLRPRGASIYHYFFAPNTLSAYGGKLQRTITRVKTVQTICSRPVSFDNVKSLLFTDKVIALSETTRDALIDAGVSPGKVHQIYPGIDPEGIAKSRVDNQIARLPLSPSDRTVLFPGDWEFSKAADYIAQATGDIIASNPDVRIIFACRTKTDAARQRKLDTMNRLEQYRDNLVFLDEVEDMPALVAFSTIVALPADSLYAKMDIPLVLLEAMREQVPLVLGNLGPFTELERTGAATCVDPSLPGELANRINQLLEDEPRRITMGRAGADAVKTQFNARLMASQVEDVYEQLLGNTAHE